jgi:hypothetical protein
MRTGCNMYRKNSQEDTLDHTNVVRSICPLRVPRLLMDAWLHFAVYSAAVAGLLFYRLDGAI